MARHLDVAGRLSEGREALGHTEIYVAACRQLGYQHPDLTGYGGQIVDWYDSEDGLDLHLLDDDCGQLWAAADAAESVLREQRGQVGELRSVWQGPGATAAADFLRGHCDAAEALTARLRAAAQACATLRDELWRCVDTKVAAVIAAEERVGPRTPAWLAAAHSVLAGTGDRAAEETVEQQLKPHVDNDIGGDWLAAMRAARSGVAAAYDAAISAAGPEPGVVFALPGALGPRSLPDPTQVPASSAVAIPAVLAPADPPPTPVPVDAPPVPHAGGAAEPLDAGFPDGLGLPEAGGMPDGLGLPEGAGLPGDFGLPGGAGLPGGLGLPGGGALGGILPRIADAIGGLLRPSEAGIGEPDLGPPLATDTAAESDADVPDDPAEEVAVKADDPPAEQGDERPGEGGPDTTGPDTGDAVQQVADEAPADGSGAVPADEQTPADPPPPAQKTPCEIAADELPQVGA